MEHIEYLTELTAPGNMGRFLVILGFVSALFATVAYFFAVQKRNDLQDSNQWRNYGRGLFIVHSLSILGVVLTLFYLIHQHRFEYMYVWQHSSTGLPIRYLFSCFWEGQEGSFMLWALWHAVLGMIMMFTGKKWEAPIMAVFAITQVFLMSMLIGLWVGDVKIGSNPFALLRDTMDAPIFQRPDYLSFIKDGNGLNPLLKNYWMTIHPPTLFLGFSSTLIPFAFVIASLWTRDYVSWVKPALPWVLFSTIILGVGILMGGAWAYESLTFGGFWAWDPVENASLVPWLCLIAGMHTLVAYRHSGYGLVATYIFFILTFLFILLSTFLTRSGILGETSVHAFTDLGMTGQLLIFMLFYIALSAFLFIRNGRSIPSPQREEASSSREFWMFVGSLVFLLSALIVIVATCVPIWNKALGVIQDMGLLTEKSKLAPPNINSYYNQTHVWIAIVLGLLAGGVQFLRYKNSDMMKFLKHVLVALLISDVLTAVVAWGTGIDKVQYILMLFAAIYASVSNLDYIVRVLKGKIAVSGGSVAHIGFGLMLVGILISNYKQEIISKGNVSFSDFTPEESANNILLRQNDPVRMLDYWVTYVGDSLYEGKNFYMVDYIRTNAVGDTVEQFMLMPNAEITPRMGIVAHPDTRHYLHRDIYTHVTSVPNKEAIEAEKDSFIVQTAGVGDTFFVAKAFVVVEGIDKAPMVLDAQDGDIAIGLKLGIYNPLNGSRLEAEPIYLIRGREVIPQETEVAPIGVKFRIERILIEENKFAIGVAQRDSASDFIVMKAIMFPWINALWIGTLITISGFIISIARRRKENKKEEYRAA
ncbi:cytochrome c biogenesis protein CcsA [soil metagenome]